MIDRIRTSSFSCLLLLITTTNSAAQPQTAPSTEPQDGNIEIIPRISKGLFEDLTRDEFDMTLPIHESIDGMWTTGEVRGKGQTNIKL